MAETMTAPEILERVPQADPFRFLDEILEVDEDHIAAAVRFKEDADFYRGHFPGNPITPGVILVEAMAQAGVVAHGIYLLANQTGPGGGDGMLTLFTDAEVEFSGVVQPGERVLIEGRKVFFRHKKLRSEVEMRREDGTVVCRGTLSGMGVAR
ncbi:MAG: beta-hydroxyacyl-ACP dehydratase [Candidatus Binatia bacterium]|nr:beta-hydroxyacyl-ACP dehydratase [Candidatus Binatia bacterium]